MLLAWPRSNATNCIPLDAASPLNAVTFYGQSLSIGSISGGGPVVISSTPHPSAKMFFGGVRPDLSTVAAPEKYQSMVALQERNDAIAPWTGGLGETGCYGFADMVRQLNSEHLLFMHDAGYGAQPLGALVRAAGSYFGAAIRQLELAAGLSGTGGLASRAMCWVQGESDYGSTSRSAYSTGLQQLALDWELCVKAGRQEVSPQMFIGNIASHLYAGVDNPTIALAQQDAAAALPRLISIAHPMYIGDYPAHEWHADAASYRWWGAYFGLQYARRVIEGDASFRASMQIVSAVRNGNGIDVTLDPIGSLVFDTTWVSPLADGNYGFQVVDSAGSQVVVSAVTITGPQTIRIACASGGGEGSMVRYAWSADAGQTGPGRVTGARGNVRDTYGDDLTFQVTAEDVRSMHRWLRLSEVLTT